MVCPEISPCIYNQLNFCKGTKMTEGKNRLLNNVGQLGMHKQNSKAGLPPHTTPQINSKWSWT